MGSSNHKTNIVRVALPLSQMDPSGREDFANALGKIAPGSPRYASSKALQDSVAKVVQSGLDIAARELPREPSAWHAGRHRCCG